MSKKIECYLDCVSPYSYHAFTYLQKNAATLKSLDVEVEYIPVFLGGINVGSGNKPPWTLPAKAAYSRFDGQRAQKYFGVSFEVPSFFPILSLLPQRALVYIKQTYPPSTLSSAFKAIFETMWLDHLDVSMPENLAIALSKAFPANQDEAQKILAGAYDPDIKKLLTTTTEKVVQEQGAFGCPWFWVSDGKGNQEPFFGSDRFHYMWDYLELPHRDLELSAKL